MFIILALIIFDGNKSTIFEDVNNCFPYTDLVSKMVRYYSSFFWGMYKVKLSEFGDKVLLCLNNTYSEDKRWRLLSNFLLYVLGGSDRCRYNGNFAIFKDLSQ